MEALTPSSRGKMSSSDREVERIHQTLETVKKHAAVRSQKSK